MKQPFPLTDVQYAYWVGRDEEQYLGGIDCHAYLEFDGENIEPERLEKAWNVLQYHHPMLRACFWMMEHRKSWISRIVKNKGS